VRILVTGHRGFIGGHLCRELRDAGHEITGADLVEGINLAKRGRVKAVLDDKRPAQIIHLAAQVGRIFGERDLRHTVSSNAEMTATLAVECGVRGIPVLYASSSEVYGDQGEVTCHEAGPVRLPHNLYGLSKRWGEEALQLYAPEGLQIVRLSMPYGPGAPPGVGRRALDNVIWQAQHGKPIPIHRGAERSWCWIEDTCRAIRLVLEEGERDYGDYGRGIYNIGRNDRRLSMYELAMRICVLVDADPSLIELIDPPSAQTVVKRLSPSKIRRLGWRPEVELEEGLPQMVDWISQFDAAGEFVGVA
jgi:dTDP-glucose 4,6-dehydratase